jgi:hypothetical protein
MLRHMTLVLGLTFLLVACGDDSVPGSDGGPSGMDSGRRDSGSMLDSGPRNDSALPLDAAAGVDAAGSDGGGTDGGTDAGGGGECAAGSAIPDRLAGSCDRRGQIICEMWAMEHGGATAVARCTPPDGRCARLHCEEGTDVCACGDTPECDDDEMCVADSAGVYSCVCITAP